MQSEVVVRKNEARFLPACPFFQLVEIRTEGKPFDLTLTGLVFEYDFLAPVCLRDPGNLLAIRRPDCRILSTGTGVAQVAGGAIFHRDGEHFTAGGHHCTLAASGNIGCLNGAGGGFPLRPQLRQVRGNLYDDFRGRAGIEVELLQSPAGFINNVRTMSTGGPDIPGRLTGDLVELTAAGIISEEVEDFFLAVGQKIHFSIQPQRVEIGRPGTGNGGDFTACRVHDLHGGGGATTVALPARTTSKQAVVTRAEGNIGQVAGFVVRAAVNARLHLFLRKAAIERSMVELAGSPVIRFAIGDKGHCATIRSPVQRDVISRMPGQALWLSAFCRQHKNI